jgi:hypothetical protein
LKIVDDDSASLGYPNEIKETIPANHSDMCKFENAEEVGYMRVSGAIGYLVEDACQNEVPEAPHENCMGPNIPKWLYENMHHVWFHFAKLVLI